MALDTVDRGATVASVASVSRPAARTLSIISLVLLSRGGGTLSCCPSWCWPLAWCRCCDLWNLNVTWNTHFYPGNRIFAHFWMDNENRIAVYDLEAIEMRNLCCFRVSELLSSFDMNQITAECNSTPETPWWSSTIGHLSYRPLVIWPLSDRKNIFQSPKLFIFKLPKIFGWESHLSYRPLVMCPRPLLNDLTSSTGLSLELVAGLSWLSWGRLLATLMLAPAPFLDTASWPSLFSATLKITWKQNNSHFYDFSWIFAY